MSNKLELSNYSFGIVSFVKNSYNNYFNKMIKPLAIVTTITVGGYLLHKYKYKCGLCPFLYFKNDKNEKNNKNSIKDDEEKELDTENKNID